MALSLMLTLTMMKMSRGADTTVNGGPAAKRRHVAVAHSVPTNASCEATEYMQRPGAMTMDALIEGRGSANAGVRDECERKIRQNVLNVGRPVEQREKHSIAFSSSKARLQDNTKKLTKPAIGGDSGTIYACQGFHDTDALLWMNAHGTKYVTKSIPKKTESGAHEFYGTGWIGTNNKFYVESHKRERWVLNQVEQKMVTTTIRGVIMSSDYEDLEVKSITGKLY